MKNQKIKSAEGFSLVELMVVITIIAILSAFTFMSLGAEKLYDADRKALQITDLLQEARQRSLSQRRTVRVEINATKKLIRLIDENGSAVASDDVVVKSVAYLDNDVLVATVPSNMSDSPTELLPVPKITFSTSTHPLSIGDSVATMRFLRNGNVTNAGTNATGTNAVPTGATIYVWSKFPNDASSTPTIGQVFRAITVLGTSGSTRLWKCPTTSNGCEEWDH